MDKTEKIIVITLKLSLHKMNRNNSKKNLNLKIVKVI